MAMTGIASASRPLESPPLQLTTLDDITGAAEHCKDGVLLSEGPMGGAVGIAMLQDG